MKRRDEWCDAKTMRRDEAARSDETIIFEMDDARNDETTMKRSEDSIHKTMMDPTMNEEMLKK